MQSTRHSILLIDDEIENLKALERTLMTVATVYTADSGKAGLEIVEKNSISLVICDQRMPEMTGIEFFKTLQKTHPHILRMILTGYTDVEDLIEAINEGGLYRYITKPWNNHELKLIVQRALERFDLEIRNRELVQELKQINEGLEKTVQDRTQKLSELAVTDELTQVGNPRYFWAQLQAEVERSDRYGHPLSLLLVDIDYFKNYNDEHGHAIGDKALKTIAQVLKKNIRSTDFIARYGGEEFAIILTETPPKKAQEMAERLRQAVVHKKFSYKIKNKKKKGLTISIGAAGYSKEKNPKKLVLRADKALYQAKRKGRNCTVCV
ncbi:MAG: diguanylate cyclase [Deltaproteobacteria bacterium]|nr:diguanylate cyclase [Deltaproteobacteria bacterium]